MHKNKKAATHTGAAQISEQTQCNGNSVAAQRSRVLAALRSGPITTLEARRLLDVLHPAARVLELRDLGYQIGTVWKWDCTGAGTQHRVAKYHLMGEPKGVA